MSMSHMVLTFGPKVGSRDDQGLLKWLQEIHVITVFNSLDIWKICPPSSPLDIYANQFKLHLKAKDS